MGYQLQICRTPMDNPQEWENDGPVLREPGAVIVEYSDHSALFRCGKAWRVVDLATDHATDISQFLWEHA